MTGSQAPPLTFTLQLVLERIVKVNEGHRLRKLPRRHDRSVAGVGKSAIRWREADARPEVRGACTPPRKVHAGKGNLGM